MLEQFVSNLEFVLIHFFPVNSWAKAEQSRGTKNFQKLETNGKIIEKYGYSEMLLHEEERRKKEEEEESRRRK